MIHRLNNNSSSHSSHSSFNNSSSHSSHSNFNNSSSHNSHSSSNNSSSHSSHHQLSSSQHNTPTPTKSSLSSTPSSPHHTHLKTCKTIQCIQIGRTSSLQHIHHSQCSIRPSPPTNQMYANVSPPVMPSQTIYAHNVSPQAFPQPAYMPPDQGMPPASSHKPGGQPPVVAGIPMGLGGGGGWRSGLCDFLDDPMNALVTAFFPCVTFGQIAEIVDDGDTNCETSGLLYVVITYFIGMPWLMSCTYRTKLRNKFGLPEAPAPDWVTHCLCESCALCQEYRELQHRGWDPSIGWKRNLAKNQMQQPVMMAPINQRMMA